MVKKVKFSSARLAVETAVAEIQARYAGRVLIQHGRHMRPEIPRIPSGSFSIDWAISGGWPRGRVCEIYGRESVGKTTLALATVAEGFRHGYRALYACSEEFDWGYAVKCGVDPDSLDFALMRTEEGNVLLDAVVDAVRSGEWDIIVVDSIAALRNWEYMVDGKSGEIAKGVGERERGGEAAMLAEFMRRLFSSFNRLSLTAREIEQAQTALKEEQAKKKPDLARIKSLEEATLHSCRIPTVLAINQLRAQGLSTGQVHTGTPGGWGLRHGKSVAIELTHTEAIWEALPEGIKRDPNLLAKRAFFRVKKCKIGPPERTGTFTIGQANIDPYWVGRLDRAHDVVSLGLRCGIIEKSGAWYTVSNLKVQGEGKLVDTVRESGDLREALEREVWIRTAEIA